jgi:hypothetical protein
MLCLVGDCCIASLAFAYSGLLSNSKVSDSLLLSHQDLSARGVPLSVAALNSTSVPEYSDQAESPQLSQTILRNLSSLICCGDDAALFELAMSRAADFDFMKFLSVFALRHCKGCWPLVVDPSHSLAAVVTAMSAPGSVVQLHNSDISAESVMVTALGQGKTVIYVLDEAPVPSSILPILLGRFEHSEISSDRQGISSQSKIPSNFSFRSVLIEGRGVVDVHASFSIILVCGSEQLLQLHPRLSAFIIPVILQRDNSSYCAELTSHVTSKVVPSFEEQRASITQTNSQLIAQMSSNEALVIRHLAESSDILGRPREVQLIESARLFDAGALIQIKESQGRLALLSEQVWFERALQDLFVTCVDISRKLTAAFSRSDPSVAFLLSTMQSLSVFYLLPHAELIQKCVDGSDSSEEIRTACNIAVKNAFQSISVHFLRVLLSTFEVPEKFIALLWFCMRTEGFVESDLLQALIDSLTAPNHQSSAAPAACPVPWLTPLQWARFYGVSALPSVRLAHAVSDIRSLRDWVASRFPELQPLPGLLGECTAVERLVLVLHLRPDRIIQAAIAFFEALSHPYLGSLLTESSHSALEQILRHTGLAFRPIVFIGDLGAQALGSMAARCGIASVEHILLDTHSNSQIIEAARHGRCVSVNIGSEYNAAVMQSCLVPALLQMLHGARSFKGAFLVSRPEDISSSSSPTSQHVNRCLMEWNDFFRKHQPHPQFRIIIISSCSEAVPRSLQSECIIIKSPPPESISPLSRSLDCQINFSGSLCARLQANLLHVLSDAPTIATEGQNSTWPVAVVSVAVLHAVLSLTLPCIGKDLLLQMVALSRTLPLQSSINSPPRNAAQLVDALLSLAITHVPVASAVMFARLRLLCECICSVNYASFMPVSPHFVSFPRVMTNSDSIRRYAFCSVHGAHNSNPLFNFGTVMFTTHSWIYC